MSVTLVYDDGEQSRHPRYRIPATVEIDGWRYPVQEWSLDGFAVAGVHEAEALEGPFPARLWFRLDGFSAVVEVNGQVARHDAADASIAVRFVDLSSPQVAVLRAVIDSYLLGEFVSMEDLIHVVRRDPGERDADERERAPVEPGGGIRALARRWLGLAIVCALLAVLLGLSAWTGYRRLYVVEAVSAVVDAPLVVIRAPQHSYFSSIVDEQTSEVTRGQPLAYAELVGGGATTIDSPCDCTILRRHVLPGEFVSLGQPLLTLLPADGSAHVNAKVRVEDARQIAIGDPVRMTLPDRTMLDGTVRRVLYGEPPERRFATPLTQMRADVISYHEVIVTPDEPLGLDLLGVPATVEVITFRGL